MKFRLHLNRKTDTYYAHKIHCVLVTYVGRPGQPYTSGLELHTYNRSSASQSHSIHLCCESKTKLQSCVGHVALSSQCVIH